MLLSQIAAAQEPAAGSGLLTFMLPIALLLVFWLVLIRPQRKRQREIAEMQRNVEPGERVMTGAGMIGTVVRVEDDEVVLEIAPGVETRFVRQAIVRKLDESAGKDSAGSETSEKPVESTSTSEETSAEELPVTHDDGRKKNS